MKYFFDTEFHEYKIGDINTIELISIGIVAEDGREYCAIGNDFDLGAALANAWLAENVIRPILASFSSDQPVSPATVFFAMGKPNSAIAEEIITFVGDDADPQFYAYYADYDWVVFCWLFGRMIDLPKGFPMYCRDLKQCFDEMVMNSAYSASDLKRSKNYPKQENEHDALDDARWNRDLYEFLARL